MLMIALSAVLFWQALPPLSQVMAPSFANGTPEEELTTDLKALLDGKWQVISVQDANRADPNEVWIEFRGDEMISFGGCNRKQFAVLYQGGDQLALLADPTPHLREHCGEKVMAFEERMNSNLAFVISARLSEAGELTLVTFKGEALRAQR